ncbi:unnamed protein product, partial [Medioppia subpectinata]
MNILVIILMNYYSPEVNGDKGLGVRSNEFRIQFLTPRPIVRQSTTHSPEMAFEISNNELTGHLAKQVNMVTLTSEGGVEGQVVSYIHNIKYQVNDICVTLRN